MKIPTLSKGMSEISTNHITRRMWITLLMFIVLGILVAVVITPWKVITYSPEQLTPQGNPIGHSIKFSPLWSEPDEAHIMIVGGTYIGGEKGLGNVYWGYFMLELLAFVVVGALAAIVVRYRSKPLH